MNALDDYAVAADLLDERGFTAVAASLREMRRRVLDLFTDQYNTRLPGLKRTWVIDGWEYASDARIMIRIRTNSGDTPPFAPEFDGDRAYDVIKNLRMVAQTYLDELTEPGLDGEWRPLPRHYPRPTRWDGQEIWDAWNYQRIRVAGRDVANGLLWRIAQLPDPEVLHDHDPEDYIPPMDVSEDPLRFRFAFGEGVVMPMKPDDEASKS